MRDVKKLSVTELRKRKFAYQIGSSNSVDVDRAVADEYFDRYLGNQNYEDNFEDAFNAQYILDLIAAVWRPSLPYKLLDCGSANGLTLDQFDRLGVEAWGIENSAFIHSKTPERWRERNLLGDVCKIPFEDETFDFLYVTCVPHVPEENVAQALKELFRVCRTGVVLHGVTTDMTEEVIEEYHLFKGIQTFWTFSEWSDAMVRAGFELAISDPVMFDEVWRIEQETDEDDWDWFPEKETMKYTFFTKPKDGRYLTSGAS